MFHTDNPFRSMANHSRQHADVLSAAFICAVTPADVAAALRMARRLTGLDAMPYLDGVYFQAWVDCGAACMEHMLGENFLELRELAWQYTERD